jgi:DNA-damage-inducible protein D
MNKDLIIKMQSQFDQLVQLHPEESGLEFWFACDLQEPLGYARWENFLTAIQRPLSLARQRITRWGINFVASRN